MFGTLMNGARVFCDFCEACGSSVQGEGLRILRTPGAWGGFCPDMEYGCIEKSVLSCPAWLDADSIAAIGASDGRVLRLSCEIDICFNRISIKAGMKNWRFIPTKDHMQYEQIHVNAPYGLFV